MRELIVASRNRGKILEIKELLEDFPLRITSLLDYPDIPDVVEDAKTYRANALKKAIEVARWTKKMTMADDSGLEIKALDNAPGIYSARFAGHGASDAVRNQKLFKLLEGVAPCYRQARYRCVIALVDAQARELAVVEGTCSGYITQEPRGANGFGFDPIFLLKRYERTFGELPSSLKAKISHRARALKKARQFLLEKILK